MARKYEFTVEGQYFTGDKKLAKYSIKCLLPSQERALSIIKKSLLEPKLRQKYADYKSYRTHMITDIQVIGDQPDEKVLSMPLTRMTISQLNDFCVLEGLMVDPSKLSDVRAARQMVSEAWEDEKARRAAEEERKEKDKENQAILDMNAVDKDEVYTSPIKTGVEVPPELQNGPSQERKEPLRPAPDAGAGQVGAGGDLGTLEDL